MTHYRENRGLDMEATAAFEDRQDARDAQQLARLSASAHTRAVCPRCGEKRSLSWVGEECAEYDAHTDDEMCGGVYRAAGGAP